MILKPLFGLGLSITNDFVSKYYNKQNFNFEIINFPFRNGDVTSLLTLLWCINFIPVCVGVCACVRACVRVWVSLSLSICGVVLGDQESGISSLFVATLNQSRFPLTLADGSSLYCTIYPQSLPSPMRKCEACVLLIFQCLGIATTASQKVIINTSSIHV